MPKLFLVILNFNSARETIRCLSSVDKSSLDGFDQEIIIVDNGSTDGLMDAIEKRYSNFRIIKNKRNLGFAGGNNVGIKYALRKKADYVFVLNPDTILEKNAISSLIKFASKNENFGVLGPKIYTPDGKIWSCGGKVDGKRYTCGLVGFQEKDYGQHETAKRVDFISGTAMLVKRTVFEKIGLFNEDYFLYYEDVDFCLRARKAGFKISFVPEAIVYHDWSSVVGKNSALKEYYMARNHFLFWERWAPLTVKVRELIRLPKTIWEHYKRGEKPALLGIRDYFLRRFGERQYDF